MTEEDWDSGFGRSIAVFLNGQGIPDRDGRGQRVIDDSFLLCFSAHDEAIDFTVPGDRVRRRPGRSSIDTLRGVDDGPAAGRGGGRHDRGRPARLVVLRKVD